MTTASTELSVTDMLPRHVGDVARLERLCFSEPWSERSLSDSIKRSDTVFLVCENDVDLLGYVGAYATPDSLDITNVAVFPEHRRKGAARALVTSLILRAQQMDVTSLTLEVRVSNESAISLYEGLGFTRVGVRRGFYSNPREDALLMTLQI